MSSSHYSDQQKYKDAGEQAARVVSEFMSIANDFSRRFGSGFSEHNPANDDSSHNSYCGSRTRSTTAGSADASSGTDSTTDNSAQYNAAEQFKQAGEYLRELREAAGYSIDGFAEAMNRQNAATKIKSVEAGHDVFPNAWLDQISALLKQNDPAEFFDKLRNLYDDTEHSVEKPVDNTATDHQAASSLASGRREKLNEIFTDESLEGLSDSQFEELSAFIKSNYQAALQLVGNK